MTAGDYVGLLELARGRAVEWLSGMAERPIPAGASIPEVVEALGTVLPESPRDAREVIARLVDAVEPGLLTSQSPRFYGWVIGGTYPVSLAADWLVGAWDQNAAMRTTMPGTAAVEELASAWLLDLLGLPAGAGVGFVTGATMANFVGLGAGRDRLLAHAGWDVAARGLSGGPRVRWVAGAERHASVDVAARYLGLGAADLVPADDQGRIDVAALEATLDDSPTIVCLQAGNVHSGAFDDLAAATAVAHEAGAWVHVDGAFGLWAAAAPSLAHLTRGIEAADSWATDAHKTLNTPYDCGLAIVADPAAVRASFGSSASYLVATETGHDPHEYVPEMSRRARGVPVWAVLATLGRSGVAELVGGLHAAAVDLATRLGELPGVEVVNDVVYTQVCVALADDGATTALAARIRDDGVAYAYPSRWRDRAVVRFSVSNFQTDHEAVEETVDAVRRALQA
ncbi:pyridoxal phosphate-dependent decarboxylase family protein [Cellulomonas edaphi]|uniref:Aminotransferase class V-fold PLP-dependent enzyme n=1 Tax=Cellulomonas edaphi TaxID=3053468 RepID=A0ABT7S2X9_9CELL|nr:aminotransferase class V-fold PLP-dependent enzyme [Cellulomons edaphi]MDM7829978.1 aminotransferase class V-fold PLP-dependent enzyme [Cellulomons edaphi]